MATIYHKLSANEYEILETIEKKKIVKLDFVEADIAHKDRLTQDLKDGINNLEAEKLELVKLKEALLKAK